MARPSHRRHNRMWPRRNKKFLTLVRTIVIMKRLWQMPGKPEMVVPWSYKLAYQRGWITSTQYYSDIMVPTGRTVPNVPNIGDMIPNTLYGLIKKEKLWPRPENQAQQNEP